ncbi:12040_t:CDS:2 [Ambispora leptoticha]|uniref:12040_t:CDS:1 n=1 Tax=Ambispora leptoticha TaxID=144679 RepID=A0A9N9HJU2_9GLOM|nr:12040_t:CDS:2 [Ambispora leptoticha]
MSKQSTPASTSTANEEKSIPTLAEMIIIRNERITGRVFLNSTKQDFIDNGLKGGPAKRLADFVKEVKEKKLKVYSLYKTVKDFEGVMRKFGIDGKEISDIPQFYPVTEKLEENDEDLQYCMDDIKYRMVNIGSATGSNEALRCEYISTILHSCLHIARRTTKDTIVLKPQLEIPWIGISSCILREMVYCAKDDYHVPLTEKILEDDSELRGDVKKVMEVIVGLLKDRVNVDDLPASKKARTEQFIKIRE